MATRLPGPGAQLMAYRYDQFNGRRPVRIRVTQANIRVKGNWVQDNRYRETFFYDANRRGTAATSPTPPALGPAAT
jgi:hypothetical protein